jgi:peptide/nickel transport system ATP-binding protein
MNLLSLKNLSVLIKSSKENQYIKLIDNINLNIKKGETLVLLGESGCGKTILADSILRLLPVNTYYTKNSEIIFNNMYLLNVSEHQMRTIRGRDISIIFQDALTALNPVLTIGQQFLEVQHKNIRNKMFDILSEVGLSDPINLCQLYPHQLSGGMRQRVLIAMALACEPKLLIADEPTTSIDVTLQLQILELINNLKKKLGLTIIFITHDIGVVAKIADRVAIMYAGHIVELGDKQQILNKPAHPYTQLLLQSLPSLEKKNIKLSSIPGAVPKLNQEFSLCRFINRCPIASEKCRESLPSLDNIDTNHDVRCFYYDRTISSISEPSEFIAELLEQQNNSIPVLEVKNLTIDFPIYKGIIKRVVASKRAVENINFKLFTGKTLAIVGESGSGKTSLAKAIMGLYSYTGIVNNHGNLLAMIFQDPYASLDPKMLVHEIIEEGHISIYNKKLTIEELTELMHKVKLDPDSLYKYPHEFSGGQRQRIAIARALAIKAKILILDEPTSALDISVQANILNLLKNLQRTYNLSYLFISHNISSVGYMADYIAVMQHGRLIEYGLASEVLSDPQDIYTQKLLSAVLDSKSSC